ncbi:class I SAM-dependent methyltransferase [Acidicapsa dinghuensis]|uniref:Class I SAM-dependent methyltransferase n=1 Tax=Acidicapsa dinghuensis TaxID=2218256 RepID=A0ABW1EFD1_9BACT|nr:class I SAM-dependent methyltransferase [Acidicapsa dinghuensis]
MVQTWNPATYVDNGAFVPALGAGVLEWLNPQPGDRILDLGCGDGQLTARIDAAGADVVGVDASAAMVEAARDRGIDARVCNAEALPFHAEFDAVFSNAALHWVHGQDAMLAGVKRALKPGGRFVAEMGGHGNIAAIQVALAAVVDRHGLGHAFNAEQRNYFPTPDSYRARLERHGFYVREIQLIPRPTPLPAGMAAWLHTFRRGVLDAIPESEREIVVNETVALLKPVLCDDAGNWTGDYVRLRFMARA